MTKILFFIDTLTGGGAEKVLRTLVNNMDPAGNLSLPVLRGCPCSKVWFQSRGLNSSSS